MLDGMLAGTDECDGECIMRDDEKKSRRFYGMSSREAQKGHLGGVKDYCPAAGGLCGWPVLARESAAPGTSPRSAQAALASDSVPRAGRNGMSTRRPHIYTQN